MSIVSPELSKVCWAAGYDPAQRFRNLADFCRKAGLNDEVEFYRKSLEALSPGGRLKS